MRWIFSAVLYTGLALGANAAPADRAGLEALRDGSMKKLAFLEEPTPAPDVAVTDMDGTERRLSDKRGKYLLVNFWATWCAPCRKELPALDALSRDFGGDSFEVITIASGPNPVPAITRLFDELGVTTLPVWRDERMALARESAVLGLPVTLILDPDGNEIARMSGDADWNSESARAIVTALTGGS